jgi:hypothetical protein
MDLVSVNLTRIWSLTTLKQKCNNYCHINATSVQKMTVNFVEWLKKKQPEKCGTMKIGRDQKQEMIL